MEDVAEGVVLMSIYLGPFFLALAIGGFFTDYILPRCPRLLRLLERLLQIDLGSDDYFE